MNEQGKTLFHHTQHPHIPRNVNLLHAARRQTVSINRQKDSCRRHSWTRHYVVCLLFHGLSYLWLPWLSGDDEAILPAAFPNFDLARRPQCACRKAIGFRRTCRIDGRRRVQYHHEHLPSY